MQRTYRLINDFPEAIDVILGSIVGLKRSLSKTVRKHGLWLGGYFILKYHNPATHKTLLHMFIRARAAGVIRRWINLQLQSKIRRQAGLEPAHGKDAALSHLQRSS